MIALVYQRLKKVQSIQTLFKKVGSLRRSTNIGETRQQEVAQRNIDLEESVSMETDMRKVSVQIVPSPNSKASKNFDYSVVLYTGATVGGSPIEYVHCNINFTFSCD